jgi:uncharacterized SAM-binding protein YcdF (DUF218 family)
VSRVARHARTVALVLLLGLLVSGVLPVATWLARPLAVADPLRPADAVVVLGGGVIDAQTPERETLVRLVHGIRLWTRGLAPLIILTGANPRDPAIPEAEVMARVAADLGVPPDSLVIERQGERTWTQGQAVARIAQERGLRTVLLVTSPVHMYRAQRVFHRAGLETVAAPTVIYPGSITRVTLDPLEVLQRIGTLSPVLYEYAAVALYRWRGWI